MINKNYSKPSDCNFESNNSLVELNISRSSFKMKINLLLKKKQCLDYRSKAVVKRNRGDAQRSNICNTMRDVRGFQKTLAFVLARLDNRISPRGDLRHPTI